MRCTPLAARDKDLKHAAMTHPLCRLVAPALFACALFPAFPAAAQDIQSDPGAYMTAITNAEIGMNQSYMAYMSAVAHSGRARKVEKMRQRALQSIVDCKEKVTAMPYYKGDNSLRKSNMDYIDMCYRVFNEDYAHIVDMESLVEQSYDEMQLYILLIEKTNEKLHEALQVVDSAGQAFGRKYQVTIVTENDQLSKEMEVTSRVIDYRYQVYLIYYKCNWEEGQAVKAINDKQLTALEQSRSALDAYAKEGLTALDSVNSFQGDPSLAQTCRIALRYYQQLAEKELPEVTDFFLKEENFQKIKKSFDGRSRKSLTKQDVDAYNQAVNDYNAGINSYNQLNAQMNQETKHYSDMWDSSDKSFMDAHIPHA